MATGHNQLDRHLSDNNIANTQSAGVVTLTGTLTAPQVRNLVAVCDVTKYEFQVVAGVPKLVQRAG